MQAEECDNDLGGEWGGGRIERLGSYLWLTPSLSLHMWACCCYFHICPCSGRWAIFIMWSAFVISTDELPCNVIKQEADYRMWFPPLPGYQSQINSVRGTLRWLAYCGCWVWSPSVMGGLYGGQQHLLYHLSNFSPLADIYHLWLWLCSNLQCIFLPRGQTDCVNPLNVEGSSFGHLWDAPGMLIYMLEVCLFSVLQVN